MIYYWNLYLGGPADGRNPLASPLKAPDLSGLPPALIITAEYDPLRDEGLAYADRLRAAGVPVQSTCYPGVFHGFLGQAALIDKGQQAIEEVAAALRAAFAESRQPVG
jgi:acetyl esterase